MQCQWSDTVYMQTLSEALGLDKDNPSSRKHKGRGSCHLTQADKEKLLTPLSTGSPGATWTWWIHLANSFSSCMTCTQEQIAASWQAVKSLNWPCGGFSRYCCVVFIQIWQMEMKFTIFCSLFSKDDDHNNNYEYCIQKITNRKMMQPTQRAQQKTVKTRQQILNMPLTNQPIITSVRGPTWQTKTEISPFVGGH